MNDSCRESESFLQISKRFDKNSYFAHKEMSFFLLQWRIIAIAANLFCDCLLVVVAATMMRRFESHKERAEPTTLRVTTIMTSLLD